MRLCQHFDTTSSLLYADVLVLCKKTLKLYSNNALAHGMKYNGIQPYMTRVIGDIKTPE